MIAALAWERRPGVIIPLPIQMAFSAHDAVIGRRPSRLPLYLWERAVALEVVNKRL